MYYFCISISLFSIKILFCTKIFPANAFHASATRRKGGRESKASVAGLSQGRGESKLAVLGVMRFMDVP